MLTEREESVIRIICYLPTERKEPVLAVAERRVPYICARNYVSEHVYCNATSDWSEDIYKTNRKMFYIEIRDFSFRKELM